MSDTEPTPSHEAAPQPPAAPTTRFRDRVYGVRGLAAVAVGGVILGGLGGYAINAATDHGGPDGRMGRFGPGGQGGPGGPGMPGGRPGPGGFNGQLPPGGQMPQPPQGQVPGQVPSQVPTQDPSQDPSQSS